MTAERFPFGVHEGKLLEDIPSDYLQWCLRTIKDADLLTAIEDEMETRDQISGHFYDDISMLNKEMDIDTGELNK